MIHTDVFNKIGLFNEKLPVCEDYDLWLRIAAEFPVLYLNEKLTIKYGGHQNQLSKKYWGMDRFRVRALEKIISQGKLTDEQVGLVLKSLLERLDIIYEGAQKRKNIEIAEQYWNKIQHWKAYSSQGKFRLGL